MLRAINDAGLTLIKTFEGCRLDAYQDVAGIWTIGYGHTHGVCAGMTLTQDQAEQALAADLSSTVAAVDRALEGAKTTDNQFAAMVALCYNIGFGKFRLFDSPARAPRRSDTARGQRISYVEQVHHQRRPDCCGGTDQPT